MASQSSQRPSSSSPNINVTQAPARRGAPPIESDRPSSPIPASHNNDFDVKRKKKQPIPTAKNTYRHKQQDGLLQALKSGGYPAILKRIEHLEQRWSPMQRISRVIGTEFQREGQILLASISRERLTSLLDNTYAFKASQGQFDNDPQWPWDFDDGPATKPAAKEFDPGMYVNYLVPGDATGLSRDEFTKTLDAIEVAMGVDKKNAKRFARGGENLRSLIHKQWNLLRGEDHDPNESYKLHEEKEKIAVNAREFVGVWRKILEELPDGILYIPIPAEVGWSAKLAPRLEQHRRLTDSPFFFMFMHCLLRILFPEKKFELHQFVVFRAAQASHAALGEAILTHLCASYSTYGGFNFDQAGKSTDSALTSTEQQWGAARARLQKEGVMALCEENLMEDVERLSEAKEEYQDDLQLRNMNAKLVRARAECDEAKTHFTCDYNREHEYLHEVGSALQELGVQRGKLLRLQATEHMAMEIVADLDQSLQATCDVLGTGNIRNDG